jgi:transposase
MGRQQKTPLRSLTEHERTELTQITKASSVRLDQIQRARALLAVADGQSFTRAAQVAGFSSGEAVSRLVERFNRCALDVLSTAAGRGRKPTYNNQDRDQVLATVRRTPEREQDGSATWSLSLLQRALRQGEQALPQIGATTVRRILHEAGYSYQRTRTWCQTGQVQRKRKEGVVTVVDPDLAEKNARSSEPTR